jgi:hypothetical protein
MITFAVMPALAAGSHGALRLQLGAKHREVLIESKDAPVFSIVKNNERETIGQINSWLDVPYLT